jgi:2-polyprenyl-6-hydroxyphenyl methylase/3-demethylubiquinone-9 3-methyltransferase
MSTFGEFTHRGVQDLEVASGKRFPFGKNWHFFLRFLDESRIAEAEMSLRTMLDTVSLTGKSFLDIGCGSGLFSLAAMRMGAEKVYSFDYDPLSVACAQELKRRYYPDANRWTIERGSVLDAGYCESLGVYDVVYSWGVLHHTGDMWRALRHVVPRVTNGGRLFIALYNDQGVKSQLWKKVKALYNRAPASRLLIVPIFVACFAAAAAASDLLLKRKNPFLRYRQYQNLRGMAFIPDVLDWLGGYPFEVAKPETIIEFFHKQGFEPTKIRTVDGKLGNNEYVFQACAE